MRWLWLPLWSWVRIQEAIRLTFFHDELSRILAEEVVEGHEDHGVGVDGLLADAPLQAVPVETKAILL